MRTLDIENLPLALKGVYDSQLKWCDKNWHSTLKGHSKELSKLVEKVDVFDIWSNSLQDIEVAKSLIPEIFMDAFISIHLACIGLYKYANACLRSEIETVLRLVYFTTHPVEFEWWREGNEWYRKYKDVWGEGYTYFDQLKVVKEFNKEFVKSKQVQKTLFNKINQIYGILSKYVHSGISAFQTSLNFSPKYNINDFKRWSSNYREVQECINLVITLGFSEKFRKIRRTDQAKILRVGLVEKDYKKRLKDIFGLKIRGRI